MIYATTRLEADIRLRAHFGGNLRGRLHQDGRWMLPISADPKDGCNRDELIKQSRYCFKAGMHFLLLIKKSPVRQFKKKFVKNSSSRQKQVE